MQFSPLLIASIALGGAIGAVARHSVSVMMGSVMGTGFPWGTLDGQCRRFVPDGSADRGFCPETIHGA